MPVVAEVAFPADAFPLDGLLDSADVRVRLDSVVPVGGSFVPYLWVAGETAVAAVTAADEFEMIDQLDGEVLVRTAWQSSVPAVFEAINEAKGAVLTGVGHDGEWTLELRFPDRDALASFYRDCRKRSVSVELRSVRQVTAANRPDCPLTEAQQEALVVAHNQGYWEVPRRTTLGDIAEELGVSDSAVSQRLRRGVDALVDDSLVDG